MKFEGGKSSIKLVIAIAIIVVIVFVGVKYVLNLINRENVKNLQADMLLVQAKVEIIKGNYSVDNEANPLKGYQLTQIPEGIDLKAFLEKNVIAQEEYESYYLLDSRKLRTNGITRIGR